VRLHPFDRDPEHSGDLGVAQLVLPMEHDHGTLALGQGLNGATNRFGNIGRSEDVIGAGPTVRHRRRQAAVRLAPNDDPVDDLLVPEKVERLVSNGGEEVGPYPNYRLPSLPAFPDLQEYRLDQLFRDRPRANVPEGEMMERTIVRPEELLESAFVAQANPVYEPVVTSGWSGEIVGRGKATAMAKHRPGTGLELALSRL